jgi:hypothetical protein
MLAVLRWKAKPSGLSTAIIRRNVSRTKILDARRASRQTLKASIKMLYFSIELS